MQARCTLTLALLSLAALGLSALPTHLRDQLVLQGSPAMELRDGVVRELIQAVADAESKPQSEEAAEDFAPDEKAELRLALAPRWRKDCKNFFWKTYTLC
ncbi:somatostatin-1-like [Callorhinchus milii]|uniref:somatostatin-1-like n=1 Tax=Callorhinchus milii TaxID=7868 RepID=UPI0004573034|nr:somatostatin-1-like [Callorhinchus milii]|eukprot:gi/632987066/ref/XP_007910587.1/ PREDICTED: somatostatin-1-like [Callorhinchus milii]